MSSELNDSYPDHVLTRTDDIQAALFELGHPDSRIIVHTVADQEIAVELLALDAQAQCFYWRPRDYASADFAGDDHHALLVGSVFQFQAQGYSGVQIRFRVGRPQIVRADDGTPALVSTFPEHLTRIQRRSTFRVQMHNTRVEGTALWQAEQQATPHTFTIHDLSVDGAGLRTEMLVESLPAYGEIIKDVTFDFGNRGSMIADLEIRNVFPIGKQLPAEQITKSTPPPLSHLGGRFVNMDAKQQTWLQQLVWALERARSAPAS